MEKSVIEKPEHAGEELEEVEGVHELFLEDFLEVGHREIEKVGAEALALPVGRAANFVGVVADGHLDAGLDPLEGFLVGIVAKLLLLVLEGDLAALQGGHLETNALVERAVLFLALDHDVVAILYLGDLRVV